MKPFAFLQIYFKGYESIFLKSFQLRGNETIPLKLFEGIGNHSYLLIENLLLRSAKRNIQGF